MFPLSQRAKIEPRDGVGEPCHILVAMRGRKGKAKPGRALRHRRRPDRDDEKAFVFQNF